MSAHDAGLLFLLVGTAFVAVAVLVVVAVTSRRKSHRRWLSEGTPGTALVTDLRTRYTEMGPGPGSTPSPVYAPVLRFTLPNGEVVETVSSQASQPPAARPGQVVEIRYDANDPSNAVPVNTVAQGGVRVGMAILAALLAAGFLLMGLVMLAIGLVIVTHS